MINRKNDAYIREQLIQHHETIAIAESVTGGLLQAAFSSMQFAMQFFQGGITTYNLGQKVKHLHVDPIHAQACNCVSERIAKEMALHVCELFHSNYGLAITGYDTAVPESGNQIFAYYAIAKNGTIEVIEKIDTRGGSIEVKNFYINNILESLAGILGK